MKINLKNVINNIMTEDAMIGDPSDWIAAGGGQHPLAPTPTQVPVPADVVGQTTYNPPGYETTPSNASATTKYASTVLGTDPNQPRYVPGHGIETSQQTAEKLETERAQRDAIPVRDHAIDQKMRDLQKNPMYDKYERARYNPMRYIRDKYADLPPDKLNAKITADKNRLADVFNKNPNDPTFNQLAFDPKQEKLVNMRFNQYHDMYDEKGNLRDTPFYQQRTASAQQIPYNKPLSDIDIPQPTNQSASAPQPSQPTNQTPSGVSTAAKNISTNITPPPSGVSTVAKNISSGTPGNSANNISISPLGAAGSLLGAAYLGNRLSKSSR